MTNMTRGLGQILVVASFVVALLLSTLPAAPTAAQPVSDVRDVKVKVRDLKLNCTELDGSATSRPSAMDDDKYIVRCTGGALDGLTCVYTPTTSDCSVEKRNPMQPGAVSQVDDPGLASVTGAADGAASAATQAAPAKGKHARHAKQGGKHRRR